jgi:hypothetical protein
MLRPALLLLLFAAAPAGAHADATTSSADAIDIAPVKSKLKILADGKGHFVALVPFQLDNSRIFWGDGKSFWQQRIYASGTTGTRSFSASFWEPRGYGGVEFEGGKYRVECDKRTTELKPLPDDAAAAMIDAAKFWKVRWRHQAYALVRDDRGVYYYVDRLREPEHSRSFRFWIGQKGSMVQQQMVNVVSDSEGDIFATRTGELRLVLGRRESTWIHGHAREPLTVVPVENNTAMIYSDLGVYTGMPLGTPCDEL